mmetsp:Transcript_87223/g.178286  ORF Transcript_87223/g.178286 Transcript_87223/m.178286 type:complete len:392 (+) Transcript_87223:987-2162(+)
MSIGHLDQRLKCWTWRPGWFWVDSRSRSNVLQQALIGKGFQDLVGSRCRSPRFQQGSAYLVLQSNSALPLELQICHILSLAMDVTFCGPQGFFRNSQCALLAVSKDRMLAMCFRESCMKLIPADVNQRTLLTLFEQRLTQNGRPRCPNQSRKAFEFLRVSVHVVTYHFGFLRGGLLDQLWPWCGRAREPQLPTRYEALHKVLCGCHSARGIGGSKYRSDAICKLFACIMMPLKHFNGRGLLLFHLQQLRDRLKFGTHLLHVQGRAGTWIHLNQSPCLRFGRLQLISQLPQAVEDQLRLVVKETLKIYLQGIGGDSEIFKNAFGRDLHSFLCAIQIAHDPGQTELDGIVINPTCQIKIFQILGGSSAQRIRWRNFWNCLDLLSVGRLQFHIS